MNFNQAVHFFEDDYRIEKFWNNPKKYFAKLSRFSEVLGIDYSVSWDFPEALKNYNYFRNNTCTFYLQKLSLEVIPQARCEYYNHKEVLAGHPKNSTIAIGARSMVRNPRDRQVLRESVKCIVDFLKPHTILWYGSNRYGVSDYAVDRGIRVAFYNADQNGVSRGELREVVNDGRS
jgi:hypothetical protein